VEEIAACTENRLHSALHVARHGALSCANLIHNGWTKMTDVPGSLRAMSLDELADLGERAEVGSGDQERIMMELARRQTIAQMEATLAQKSASEAEEKAAKAIVDTALHTERSANYLFWSVIAATLSTMITAAGVLFHLFGRG
ncbi:MAG: hypothetical protein WBE50_12010, partial [Methyloceanibacter sp.]